MQFPRMAGEMWNYLSARLKLIEANPPEIG